MTTMRHYTRAEIAKVYNSILGELLPGKKVQGVQTLSTVKNYRTGSRMALGNKVYHYGQAGGALLDNMLSFAENPQDAGMRVIGVVAAAGAISVTLTINSTEGPEQDGSVPENYLQNGTVVFMTALGIYVRGIVSNTVKVAGTGTLVVVLDAPISFALVLTDSAEIIASRYAAVVAAGDVVEGAVLAQCIGRAPVVAADGDWMWFQTWGPTWVSTALTLGVGSKNRSAFVGEDGSIHDFAGETGASQRVGHVMAAAVGGGQGAPFVNLEIDP